MNAPDTIVALSSGRLPAGVAVIRVSGKATRFAIETIVGNLPEPSVAVYRHFQTPFGERIDSGLLLFFASPHSFTGEDCAEFHLHGSKATVAALLHELTALPGIRHAEAGEFTRRAFLNGKLDLTKTEALADLIAAETEAQRRLAVLNAAGAQSQLYAGWRHRLIHAQAMIEAELDFADESDVPGSVADIVWADVQALADEITAHIGGFHRAEMIRDGYDVVILGAPNAGKSSLLNALAKRDAAIVSDEPGTTRDLVELSLDLDGVKVRLTDTAGIREGAGKVEAIGIERAQMRAETADLALILQDMTDAEALAPSTKNLNVLRVGTKADLLTADVDVEGWPVRVSASTGSGIAELLRLLIVRAVEALGNSGDILPSRLRHVELLRDCVAALQTALTGSGQGLELRADDLRRAADRLGRITGAVDTEDLLDVIFSQFCIGK
jgi:tRNA modification GTPase